MRVELTFLEMFNACMVGVSRRLSSMRSPHITNSRHSDRSDWDIDINGAIAEACFAKFHNVYWSASINTFKALDVDKWQVRSTSHANGHLIVRPKDTSNDAIALVVTEGFGGTILGWIMVVDAKKDDYWRDDSWWVPQPVLNRFI